MNRAKISIRLITNLLSFNERILTNAEAGNTQPEPFIKNLNVHFKNFKGKIITQKSSVLFLLRDHNLYLNYIYIIYL